LVIAMGVTEKVFSSAFLAITGTNGASGYSED
jgi:hypothetical protein